MNAGMRILLLFDNNGAEYVSRIRESVTRTGRSSGFQVVSENLFSSGRQVADVIADDTIAGVILTPPLSDDRHVLGLIEERKLPYVRIAPMLDLSRGCTVIMDEYDAARAITDYLLQRGHRRIGFVRGPNVHLVSMRRYNGYANAIGGKGLRIDHALVAQGDFSRQSGREQAAALFAAKPTAIFASNDEMAAGIIDAAVASGISVPDDISLVGFDDNAVAKTIRPGLTTVRQPLEEMGEMACKLVAERVIHPARGARHEQIPFQIVERASVIEAVARAA
ncbi:substrate-binding domain-containing protein [Altererythrobacter salegens]|uniref:Substrate-binding domain-containing protein n=1 Tax=Croceibacterium salegens TaxID=1737568 RepID=A0A6I4SXF0_9SPHN|nr:substrate-binding domain-containing protein [Croceibacterium salegens]MXO60118.1 substrate-binding domain-containing protein [Croceibacterium salegens]